MATASKKISAIVVTLNEERRLRDCLGGIQFCDEIVAVDLGSADDSVKIAEELQARCLTHERVPFGEKVLPNVVPQVRNDWILRIDPDEVIPPEMAAEIQRTIDDADGDLATIQLPHHYYYCGKRLRTTRWGKVQNVTRIFHRDRVQWRVHVHSGVVVPKPGMKELVLPATESNPVRHYWVDSFASLLEKHRRYIKHEGEARYARSERFSWVAMLHDVYRALGENLIGTRAIFDGLTPSFLSFFYAWYVAKSHLSLREFERGIRRGVISEPDLTGTSDSASASETLRSV